ncbi:hypothetical protein ACFE04_013245 [Oxalis oulophora]
MISRVSLTKPRKTIIKDEDDLSKSGSILDEYDDCIVGFMDDIPLIPCGNSGIHITLREVLRASVGVIGESRLGITEKVVLLKGKICVLKRFRKLSVRRTEFGRRVAKLAMVSCKSKYLVPVTAYLYAKRIKFLLCDYYPMGSLADLLAGGRDRDHTALDWNQRLTIILNIAEAIAFIHDQCPSTERNLIMNVHGNIKSSNVMINIDLTASLADYGFIQLAQPQNIQICNTPNPNPITTFDENYYIQNNLSQKSDIYNFGMILFDVLGGSRMPGLRNCIMEKKEEIIRGSVKFFEFSVDEKDRTQALQVMEIALACTKSVPETRPSITQIKSYLADAVICRYSNTIFI